MTGGDRAWAPRYQIGDVIHCQFGSADIGIRSGSYAQVIATDSKRTAGSLMLRSHEVARSHGSIFTDNFSSLEDRLIKDIGEVSALDFGQTIERSDGETRLSVLIPTTRL
jgi:hypothetical protein